MTLSRTQRAAAIVLAIGKERAGRLIGQFRKEELKLLVEAARSLRNIAPPDLQQLAAEFEKDFRVGAGLVDSSELMDVILGQTLSPEEVEKLTDERTEDPAPAAPSLDVWGALAKVEAARLSEFLTAQSPMTVAFIVGRLAPEQTVDVLKGLDEQLRRPLFAHMLSLTDVPAITVEAIGDILADALDLKESGGGRETENVLKVAEILNAVHRDDADRYIAEIAAATDPAKADAIRARLFRFEDVAALDAAARTTVFDGMGSEMIIAALADSGAEVRAAVLAAISQRMRRMVEAELESARVAPDRIRQARRDIVQTVMRLAGEGRISLPKAA